jgi:hypothetical protein
VVDSPISRFGCILLSYPLPLPFECFSNHLWWPWRIHPMNNFTFFIEAVNYVVANLIYDAYDI